ncbi:unnamed protein product [Arabidopsis halleri]
MEDVRKEREEDKLHQLLMGLDESIYGTVKSSLLSRVPLPLLEEAYNVLQQEDESKSASCFHAEMIDGVSFAVQTQSRQASYEDHRNHTCKLCGKIGHFDENCFKKIGYPPWWVEKPRNKSNQASNGGRVTTSAPLQSSRGRGSAEVSRGGQANAMVVSRPSVSALNTTVITDSDRVGLSGLNDHQWKSLVQMLEERQSTSTDRLNVCDMPPVLIKLPDGRFTTSTRQGTVQLGSSLRLSAVYLVDELKCHLISVSQLTRDSGCVFQITDRLCVVQERISRTVIGAGEQRNGLHFFRGVAVASAVQRMALQPLELWHKRLGHPSSKVLNLLEFSSSCSSFDSHSYSQSSPVVQAHDDDPLAADIISSPPDSTLPPHVVTTGELCETDEPVTPTSNVAPSALTSDPSTPNSATPISPVPSLTPMSPVLSSPEKSMESPTASISSSSPVATDSPAVTHSPTANDSPASHDSPAPPIPSPEKLGPGLRKKNPPVKLADYVTMLLHQPHPSVKRVLILCFVYKPFGYDQ